MTKLSNAIVIKPLEPATDAPTEGPTDTAATSTSMKKDAISLISQGLIRPCFVRTNSITNIQMCLRRLLANCLKTPFKKLTTTMLSFPGSHWQIGKGKKVDELQVLQSSVNSEERQSALKNQVAACHDCIVAMHNERMDKAMANPSSGSRGSWNATS